MLQTAPSLTEQIYEAIVDEICDGRLAPGQHLVQESLARRFGVSRQPVQQAMARLKADAMVEVAGRRGLCVAPLDLDRMRQHYGVRAALDGWSARVAAARVAEDPALAGDVAARGRAILAAGEGAVASGDVVEQVHCDRAFHVLLHEATGNPLIARTAEPHWRFLRRAMGDVLRRAERPSTLWRQHAEILEAVLAGDAAAAERRALAHVDHAAERLARALDGAGTGGAP